MKPGGTMVKFGEVVRQCKESVDRDNNSFERYVEGGHMDSESIHICRWGEFGADYVGPAFHRIFRKGQVLYGSRRTYLKKVAIAGFDGITANTTFVCETKNQNVFMQELLPFLMLTDSFTEHSIRESKGSTNPYINWPDIAKYEFPLPPLDEQKRMAEILWAADEAVKHIITLESEAEKARRVSLFEFMANGAGEKFRGLTSRSATGPWRVERVFKVGDVQLDRQRAPKYQSGKWTRPYLRVANVFDSYFDLEDVLSMDFDNRDFARYELRSGDILLNEGQSRELVGRCAMFADQVEGCCFQNTLIRFRCGDEIIPESAFSYFQYLFYRETFAAISRQTTSIAHLGADTFKKLFMPVPPIDEQRKIAGVMDRFNASKRDLARQRENVKRTRQTLINGLIGGSHV